MASLRLFYLSSGVLSSTIYIIPSVKVTDEARSYWINSKFGPFKWDYMRFPLMTGLERGAKFAFL